MRHPWCILSHYRVQCPQQVRLKGERRTAAVIWYYAHALASQALYGITRKFSHQPVLDLLLLRRHRDCSTKARGQASTTPLTLRARLKKGPWTALRTVGRTLVSCQPELAAGQT